MLKAVLFKFILIFYRKDFKISRIFKFLNCSDVRIHYIFNNKPYIYIGDPVEFPPTIAKGFVIPIHTVTTESGEDVTQHVKMCSGPKNDFYGNEPKVPLILGKLRIRPRIVISNKLRFELSPVIVPSKEKTITVKNIFNQTQVLGRM